MIPIEDVFRIIEDTIKPSQSKLVMLDNVLGCRLCEDEKSEIDIPGFTGIIMDGIALNTDDLTGLGPWELPI